MQFKTAKNGCRTFIFSILFVDLIAELQFCKIMDLTECRVNFRFYRSSSSRLAKVEPRWWKGPQYKTRRGHFGAMVTKWWRVAWDGTFENSTGLCKRAKSKSANFTILGKASDAFGAFQSGQVLQRLLDRLLKFVLTPMKASIRIYFWTYREIESTRPVFVDGMTFSRLTEGPSVKNDKTPLKLKQRSAKIDRTHRSHYNISITWN